MELELTTIRKSLNKAYLRETISRADFDQSVIFLKTLIQKIDQAKAADETEEHHKFFLPDFFKGLGFENHYINTDGRTDLAIHNGSKKDSAVAVMIETKKPGSNEMISAGSPNRKAIREAILYYLRERIEKGNSDDKHIIITDLEEWFIFDAQEFHRHFIENGTLKKEFEKWSADQKSSSNNPFMYNLIEEYLDDYEQPIKGTHFSFGDFRPLIEKEDPTEEEERELIPLVKLLSPVHLLKKPFKNDSNSLDRQFYDELLYILGLEEQEAGSAKLIDRPDKDDRIHGSLIENTISTLRYENRLRHVNEPEVTYGKDKEEQLFGVGMELCILWINRILFLKLLEAQLYRYHREDDHFKFLNFAMVDEFDELNKLFLWVLAIREEEREETVKEKFGHIPYLNSSLFEVSSLEDKTTRISGLDDKVTMPVYRKTVLKDNKGKSEKGKELNTLEYLFRFLEAYNFSAEGKEEIEEENKSLINASVLGLIFEKINGYKDGSFYTPGFITEYMCRETLRKSVLEKFNRLYQWECEEFGELYNKISREGITLAEANEVVNSITVCDPAVGSGHFLVSALNELIAIKSDLGIFCDSNYKVFGRTKVHVEHDELVVTHGDDELFEYNLKGTWTNGQIERSVNAEKERLQKALFEEKRQLIENSLFGVDINPNSVKICRLRLWIELLKHAYYTDESDHQKLEVLPNIDINIKQGNSLVSRFDLDTDLDQILKETDYTLDDYKQAVADYKDTRDQQTKRELRTLIKEMKEAFEVGLEELHPERRKLKKLEAELIREQTQHDMFGDDDEHGGSRDVRVKKLEKKVANQQKEVDELEAGTFYRQAFEWRFQFPEVLDGDGHFTGFDVVIGNPPYIRQEELGDLKEYLKQNYDVYKSTADVYTYFYELGHTLLRENGWFSMITSNKFMRTNYGEPLRNYLSEKQKIQQIIDFGELPVFEEASTFPSIFLTQKGKVDNQSFNFFQVKELEPQEFEDMISDGLKVLDNRSIEGDNWSLAGPIELDIIEKMRDKGVELEDYVGKEIKYGIKTGLNKSFIIDEDKRDELIKENPESEEIIKPVLKGNDIRFYRISFKDLYLIVTKIGVHIEKYPAVKEHLDQSVERLKKRYDQGDHYWELRACDYYDEFEKPKIIYPDIAKESRFTLDKEGYYLTNTAYFIPSSDKYVLGILNSKLVFNYYKRVSSVLGDPDKGGRMRWFRQDVSKIPIAEPGKKVRNKIESLVDQILSAKEDDPDTDTSELEAQIDRLVYELYGLTDEEIAIVEESVSN